MRQMQQPPPMGTGQGGMGYDYMNPMSALSPGGHGEAGALSAGGWTLLGSPGMFLIFTVCVVACLVLWITAPSARVPEVDPDDCPEGLLDYGDATPPRHRKRHRIRPHIPQSEAYRVTGLVVR